MSKYTDCISISGEVKNALKNSEPVVALESTIISHGMPYPDNLETALKVEKTVRKHGAVPATIAIIKGVIKIGLDEAEIEFLSKEKGILKASRMDIPAVVSKKLSAATTVSGTMICAELAGIKFFATGGIGGVHRGGQNSMDISADLTELSRTNVAVISAGVKSILDIELTLEYLETAGVPVIGYNTDEFPAFFTRQSGFRVNHRFDSAKEISAMIKTKWELGLSGGVLIANPIPEEFSMKKEIIDKAIEDALKKVRDSGIKGKEVTPFLLSEIKKTTGGLSLESNVQLVLNNAKLASEISSQFLLL